MTDESVRQQGSFSCKHPRHSIAHYYYFNEQHKGQSGAGGVGYYAHWLDSPALFIVRSSGCATGRLRCPRYTFPPTSWRPPAREGRRPVKRLGGLFFLFLLINSTCMYLCMYGTQFGCRSRVFFFPPITAQPPFISIPAVCWAQYTLARYLFFVMSGAVTVLCGTLSPNLRGRWPS